MVKEMIIVSTETIPGKPIVKALGVVRGNTVRAKHIGHDIGAGLKGLIGGEIDSYTTLLSEARDQAIRRMVENASVMGADAIVNVRFATSSIMRLASEVLVYGTAVKLK